MWNTYREFEIMSKTLKATIEWRILAFLIDLSIIYGFIGEYKKAWGIAILTMIIKSGIFYVWYKTNER